MLEGPVKMGASLCMYRDDIGAAVCELCDVTIRLLHHQVNVQNLVCHFPESPNHGHSEIDARDEVSVHDIHMNIGSSRLVNGADLLSQSAVIGSQH